MPRDQSGKNRKVSKYKERDNGDEQMQRIVQIAAERGVEIWEIRPEDLESDEDSEQSEEVSEEEKKEVPQESDSDEEVVVKGHQGLIEIENPNRVGPRVPKPKREDLVESHRENVKREQQQVKQIKRGKTQEAQADLQRLAEIRAKREAAAKQREEQKKKSEELKIQANSRFKRRK